MILGRINTKEKNNDIKTFNYEFKQESNTKRSD